VSETAPDAGPDHETGLSEVTNEPGSKKPKKRKARRLRARTSGAGVKRANKAGGAPRRPFPAVTLEDAVRIPKVIKELNGGNPWPLAEVANALDNMSARGDKFWYLSSGARDYGLTTGTRDTDQIALDTLGRQLVYATSPEVEIEALRKAFSSVEVFKQVYEYYQGNVLPDLKYLQNTLESVFKLPSQYHEEFVRIYTANCQFLSGTEARLGVKPEARTAAPTHSVVVGEPKGKADRVAFIVMPFTEKTDRYPPGFFVEVLKSLITPATVACWI
jgi:hypothetical protein